MADQSTKKLRRRVEEDAFKGLVPRGEFLVSTFCRIIVDKDNNVIADAVAIAAIIAGSPLLLQFALPSGVNTATVDISSLGLTTAPRFIDPKVIKPNGGRTIVAIPVAGWTNISFKCDFTGQTDDTTYLLQLVIYR